MYGPVKLEEHICDDAECLPFAMHSCIGQQCPPWHSLFVIILAPQEESIQALGIENFGDCLAAADFFFFSLVAYYNASSCVSSVHADAGTCVFESSLRARGIHEEVIIIAELHMRSGNHPQITPPIDPFAYFGCSL